MQSRRGSRGRGGFNIVGVILLIFILAGVGMFFTMLARQAGRGSHWFFDAQTSYDLADAGLKEASYWLDKANSAQKAADAPVMKSGLVKAFDALKAGQKAGPIDLVSDEDPASLTGPLKEQLGRLADRSPKLKVTLRVEDGEPLWQGSLKGIPADPREHKLVVTLVARASVKAPAGIRVERVITADRGARVLSLLPPIVGRFALFVHPGANGQDTNILNRTFDDTTGDGRATGGGAPLVIRSKPDPKRVQAAIVSTGSTQLNRAQFVQGIADTKFLDHQGWIFLGGSDANPWKINLAHGYSAGGDSPLLPGDRKRHLYKGNQTDDTAFAKRYEDTWLTTPGTSGAVLCIAALRPDNDNKDRGLYQYHHGTASNYEIIGFQKPIYYQVQSGGARTKFKFPEPNVTLASALRLFGEPGAFSPTLVFGPVIRTYFRRSQLLVTLGVKGICPSYGTQFFANLNLEDHVQRTRTILEAAFQGQPNYKLHGSGRVDNEPYIESLNVVLNSKGTGKYGPDGRLYLLPDSGGGKTFGSDRLQGLPGLPANGAIPDAVLKKLMSGDVDVKDLFKGNLHQGFAALTDALNAKLAYKVTPQAFTTKIFVKKELKVPGIAIVESAIDIGPVDRVVEGGILLSTGAIRIKGDIKRGSANEPLTLVSNGPITIDPSVKVVEAHLVALGAQGKVTLPPGPFTLTGGLAGKELDLPSLQGGTAPRIIEYVEDMDPLGPYKDSALRVFYGIEPRISVDGGGS